MGISKLGKSNWEKRKIDWSLEEWVKMWKKVMYWGRNGKVVCMYLLRAPGVSAGTATNDVELIIARSSPAPSPRSLPRQRVQRQG